MCAGTAYKTFFLMNMFGKVKLIFAQNVACVNIRIILLEKGKKYMKLFNNFLLFIGGEKRVSKAVMAFESLIRVLHSAL